MLLLLLWKAAKNTGETTNAETPNAFGGQALRPPPQPPSSFFYFRFPPLNVVAAVAAAAASAAAAAGVVVVVVNSKTPQKEENNICRAAQCIWGGGRLPQFNPQLFSLSKR